MKGVCNTRLILGIVAVACIACGGLAAGAGIPLIRPESGPWDGGNGFRFEKKSNKARQALSGIACSESALGQRVCLVVFDEANEARYIILSDKGYSIDSAAVPLQVSNGELDAEGAATDERFFYVTGSHSVKRTACENNPDSRQVIRFAVDPKTGRALRNTTTGSKLPLVGYAASNRLWSIMSSHDQLKNHIGDRKCLGTEPPERAPQMIGQRGVNIEGLAVKNGRLYFGFRGPAEKGSTMILSVEAEGLFTDIDPKSTITRITLGEGRGIRDLHAVKDGFLVLAGPDDDRANEKVPWMLTLWDGKSAGDRVVAPKTLAILDLTNVKLRPCDAELKPEAFAVWEETPQHYRIVVFSDGMCDGGPLAFKIPR